MLRNICLTNNHPHGVRLLFLCLMFLLFANLSKAVNTYEIVNDTCYVEYNGNGDSLLVIIQSAWFSDGDHHVSYYVSFTNHPVRPEQQVVPLFPQEVGGVARLSQRDSQISHYMKLHEEYLRQQVDSIIGALLPNGAEIKIRESYPYEYRYIHLDVDKEGCIHAANLYIRNPVLFILTGGVQGCGDILRAFIGKHLPTEQLPTIGNGFQMEIKYLWGGLRYEKKACSNTIPYKKH